MRVVVVIYFVILWYALFQKKELLVDAGRRGTVHMKYICGMGLVGLSDASRRRQVHSG